MSDEERHEVARRLRESAGTAPYMNTSDDFAREVFRAAMNESVGDYRAAVDRLADLIEPSCDEGRYSVARTVRPVDREALLAIADEIDAAYIEAAQMLGLPRAANEGTVFSRRIREALGVER